jgi:hypothetical protein
VPITPTALVPITPTALVPVTPLLVLIALPCSLLFFFYLTGSLIWLEPCSHCLCPRKRRRKEALPGQFLILSIQNSKLREVK